MLHTPVQFVCVCSMLLLLRRWCCQLGSVHCCSSFIAVHSAVPAVTLLYMAAVATALQHHCDTSNEQHTLSLYTLLK
jgi:hypothetical protein